MAVGARVLELVEMMGEHTRYSKLGAKGLHSGVQESRNEKINSVGRAGSKDRPTRAVLFVSFD